MSRRSLLWVLCVASYIGCGGRDNDDETVPQQEPQSACTAFCAARQQASCPSVEGISDCQTLCKEDEAMEPQCLTAFTSMANCAASAPMTCGARGAPIVTADCTNEDAVYESCLEANGWISVGEPCNAYTCAGVCDVLGCVECAENADCKATQECSGGACRDRCLSDADCPGSFCYADSCGDPVGTPCDMDGLFDCRGGDCTDVDANLTTVDPYCTISCISTPCPAGYTCQQNDCRRI